MTLKIRCHTIVYRSQLINLQVFLTTLFLSGEWNPKLGQNTHAVQQLLVVQRLWWGEGSYRKPFYTTEIGCFKCTIGLYKRGRNRVRKFDWTPTKHVKYETWKIFVSCCVVKVWRRHLSCLFLYTVQPVIFVMCSCFWGYSALRNNVVRYLQLRQWSVILELPINLKRVVYCLSKQKVFQQL